MCAFFPLTRKTGLVDLSSTYSSLNEDVWGNIHGLLHIKHSTIHARNTNKLRVTRTLMYDDCNGLQSKCNLGCTRGFSIALMSSTHVKDRFFLLSNFIIYASNHFRNCFRCFNNIFACSYEVLINSADNLSRTY